jgi:predicted CoA-binding protein
MQSIKEATAAFLANKRVAVTGVSGTPRDHGSNTVCKRLRDRGYEVFAVNPNADRVEGDPSYLNLKSIPGGVQAVVIGTGPEIAKDTMRECVELGINQVWICDGVAHQINISRDHRAPLRWILGYGTRRLGGPVHEVSDGPTSPLADARTLNLRQFRVTTADRALGGDPPLLACPFDRRPP